jgi:DNA-binding SARP family transcriptional activator
MPSKLVIQLLSDFHITYNGQALESFGTARLQSFLANLLLHHDIPQSCLRLPHRLWPDSSEISVRNNLRQQTYRLRLRQRWWLSQPASTRGMSRCS